MGALKEIGFWFFSWIFMILMIPSALLYPFVLIPYKSMVNLIVRMFRPGWLPLGAFDCAFSFTSEWYKASGKLLNNIGLAFVVDGDVDVARLRKRVQEKLLFTKLPLDERQKNRKYRFDRLRRYPVKFMGHFYWSNEMPSVDINTVVKESRTRDTDLEVFLNRWLHTGYKDQAPIWEIMVYKGEGEYVTKSVVAFKISHALGDEYSLRTFCDILAGVKEDREFFQDTLLLQKESWVRPKEMLAFLTMGPYLLLKMISSINLRGRNMDVLAQRKRATETLTCFMSMKLETVNKIQRAYECNFNDVILTLFGNVLRKHLLESNPEDKLPKEIPFAVSVEVPNRPDEICNQISLMLTTVPVSGEDRKAKLNQMKKNSTAVNQFGTHKLLYYFSNLLYYIPHLGICNKEHRTNVGLCCAMTNLPSLKCFDQFGAYPVQRILCLPGQHTRQVAFFGTTLTRGDTVEVTLLGNSSVFKNAEAMNRLKEYVTEELQLLLETVETRQLARTGDVVLNV